MSVHTINILILKLLFVSFQTLYLNAFERVPVQVPNMFAFERDRHRVPILISTRRTTQVNISKIQQL